MSDGFDVYSRVVLFGITGPQTAPGVPNMVTDESLSNYWYSAETVQSKSEPKAVLAVNTAATGISFNAYSYGTPMSGVTNYIRFSENIQAGLTALGVFNANRWYSYGSSSHPSGTNRFSPIRMPDGTTNGVRLICGGGAGTTQAGLYQPLGVQSPGIFTKGKMYTVSVWACGDSGGGVYTENPKFRIGYYGQSPLSVSLLSQEWTLTPVPTRYSFTFVSYTNTSSDQDNIAFSCGYNAPSSQIVLWGAQVCDGNTANNYIPTSTEWKGVVAPIGSGTISGPLGGIASADSYNIDVANIPVPPQSTQLLNIAPFAVSNDVQTSYTRPTTFSVYGLY